MLASPSFSLIIAIIVIIIITVVIISTVASPLYFADPEAFLVFP